MPICHLIGQKSETLESVLCEIMSTVRAGRTAAGWFWQGGLSGVCSRLDSSPWETSSSSSRSCSVGPDQKPPDPGSVSAGTASGSGSWRTLAPRPFS